MKRPTYAELGDSCLTAHALELIGQRWTYPVLRELMLGPRRFGDLLASLPGLTPATLSTRLRDMTDAGLVLTEQHEPPVPQQLYGLTDWALDLGPVLQQVGRWAQHSPSRPAYVGLTPDAAVQAMTTMVGSHRLTPALRVELRLSDARRDAPPERYDLSWSRRGLHVARRRPTGAGTALTCDSNAWAELVLGVRSARETDLDVDGDREVADRLVRELRAAAATTMAD